MLGNFVASAAAGGGVQLSLNLPTIADVRDDFNGDGRSDVMWRNDAGVLVEWLGQANGSFADNGAVASYSVPTDWHVQPVGTEWLY